MEDPADFRLYVCPDCRGGLASEERGLLCRACQKTYVVHGEIPDFLGELTQSTNPVFRRVKMIDRLAPIYETKLWYPIVINLFGGFGCTSLPRLVTLVREMVHSTSGLVLDVACGPGTFGRRVASASRRVYGIDISPGMLEQGLAYSLREQVTNIRFARAKVEALPFPNAVFDAALVCGSLHLFQDTVLALREISRTMKPGAPLAAVTVMAGKSGLLRFPRVRKRMKARGLRVFDVRELERDLSEAGFAGYRPQAYGSLLAFRARKG